MNDYYGMSLERYDYLMDSDGPCVHLSEEELKEGWHFCMDWDDMLIHPDSDEFHCCTCPYMQQYKTKERELAYQQRREQAQQALDKIAQLDEELGLTDADALNYFANLKDDTK